MREETKFELADLARECGGIRSGTFEPVKRWTFTEDGLVAFIARVQSGALVLTDVEILDLAQDFRVVERPTSYEPYETFDYVGFARAILARSALSMARGEEK